MTDIDILNIRKKIDEELGKLPQCQHGQGAETKDFDLIKDTVVAHIAYKIWENKGKPQNSDAGIWFEAVETWNFVRHMW